MVDGVGIEGGSEPAGVTAVWHFLVVVRVIQVGHQFAQLRMLQFTYSTLVFAKLFHMFLVEGIGNKHLCFVGYHLKKGSSILLDPNV